MNRFRRMTLLLLAGVLVIIFVALGIVYMQQGAKQRELEEQINKLSLTLRKPLPSAEKLQADYDEVSRSLTPLTREGALDIYRYIDIIVSIAEESGIDVGPDSGKFHIPAQNLVRKEKVGESNYQVLSFQNIRVQGDNNSVMAFISNLESGEKLKALVLRRVDTSRVELERTEEEDRKAELNDVQSAVIAMMVDNGLATIPNPIDYAGGTAVNLLGDDPDTTETVEGFPDITTTVADKGYMGTGNPRNGYVLYEHDKVDPDDAITYTTVSYASMSRTKYYYTCEADGIVRQFDGPDVATATEYHLTNAEFSNVQSAVIAMMVDNGLAAIPKPIDYAGGIAVNLLGDNPDTTETVEGFPDIATTATEKGYTGIDTPRNGYVLYKHDKIDPDDTTTYSTVYYISILGTEWYYTCEADGIVRQWSGPDVATATEYPHGEGGDKVKVEVIATLDVDIFTRPGGD